MSLAEAREAFIKQYQSLEEVTGEDMSGLYEEEPEITLQQLILWDRNFTSSEELAFDFSTNEPIDLGLLRQATEEIEMALKEYHLTLPLWAVGRIQELTVNQFLKIEGIQPLLSLLSELPKDCGK